MGIKHLFDKRFLGQGQTVAIIEFGGEWGELQKVIQSKKQEGELPNALKENYGRHFLPAISGPGLNPHAPSTFEPGKRKPIHGGRVATVVLDHAPLAKVLPVSTYIYPHKIYDVAAALMDLAKRKEVKVINISAGELNHILDTTFEHVPGDVKIRNVYNPKFFQALKTVIQAGKAVVLAAGNDNKEINIPIGLGYHHFLGHLLEKLTPDEQESLIFAGNWSVISRDLAETSNRAGPWKAAQDVFLCADGCHWFAYKGKFRSGTSFASPFICAALADLLSKSPKITPRMAAQALKKTAKYADEKRSDRRKYGRGVMRADLAEELLDRQLWGK